MKTYASFAVYVSGITVLFSALLSPNQGLTQSHWNSSTFPTVYSPSALLDQTETWADGSRHIKCSASANSCGSLFEMECAGVFSGNASGITASVSTGKILKHTGNTYCPSGAVASASGNMSFSASASGGAITAAGASGSAASSGTIAGAGQSTGQKSVVVNGSCSASSPGSVGISKDGVSVSNTSPPPGSFSGADTHSAVFSASNYVFMGDTITLSASASAVTSGGVTSSYSWLFFPGSATATGSASVSISALLLNANCQPGG